LALRCSCIRALLWPTSSQTHSLRKGPDDSQPFTTCVGTSTSHPYRQAIRRVVAKSYVLPWSGFNRAQFVSWLSQREMGYRRPRMSSALPTPGLTMPTGSQRCVNRFGLHRFARFNSSEELWTQRFDKNLG